MRTKRTKLKLAAAKAAAAKPKRARTTSGAYKADDPKTPEVNEAWVGGVAPKKEQK